MVRNYRIICVEVMFYYALLMPSFHNLLDTKGIAVINGGILILFITCIMTLRAGGIIFTNPSERLLFLLIACSILLYGLLIGVSSIINNTYNLNIEDAYDYNRPISLLAFFASPFIFVRYFRDIKAVERILHRFMVLALISIGLFYTLKFIIKNSVLLSLYTKEHNVLSMRLSSPFANPYDLGIFLTLLLIYFSILYLRRSFWYVIPITLALFLILHTQSRVAFITAFYSLLTLFTYSLWEVFIKQTRYIGYGKLAFRFNTLLKVIFIAVIALGLVITLWDALTYLSFGFKSYISGSNLSSWSTRQEQIHRVIELMEHNFVSIFVGHGPGKEIIRNVENNYFFYLFRYGMVGLVFFFLVPSLIGIYFSLACYKKLIAQGYTLGHLFLAVSIWFFSIMTVASLGNNFSEQMRLAFFYWFFLGLSIRVYYLSRNYGSVV